MKNAAAEGYPLWSAKPITAFWDVSDPVCAEGSRAARQLAFFDTYRLLRGHTSIFVGLPMGSLDKLTLQRDPDGIGEAVARAS